MKALVLAGLLGMLLPAVPPQGGAEAAPLVPPPGWHPAVLAVALAAGGTVRALLLRPDRPRAALVMLPGGDGEIGIAADGAVARADNVVIRTAALWLARGYALLIPDAGGNLRGTRSSPAYGAAVAALVAEAHRTVPGPVALVGTSQGAIAAVNGAGQGGISGLVLLEAVSRLGGSRETVFDADPAAVSAPVLVVANAADRCPVTPPGDAARIAAAFTRAARVDVLRLTGPEAGGRACGSLAAHGYRGIEADMVGGVADWLAR